MEKLAKKLTIKYSLLLSFFWLNQCIIMSFAAVYLFSKGFTNTQVGWVLSISSILSVFLQPMVGSFADKAEKISLRYITMALMLVVFVLALMLLILPEAFLLIAVLYILILTLQVTLASLMNSLALEYVNKGIPVNYGLGRGISSVAYAIAAITIGIATDYFNGGIIIPIFLVSYIFLILMTWNFKINISENMTVPSTEYLDERFNSKGNSISGKKSILHFFLKNKKFTLYLLGVTMLFYSHNLINSYMINIMENVGGSKSDMGAALFIAATLELPVMAAFFFLIRKIKCSSVLKFAGLFFTIKAAITWLAPSVGTVLFSQVLQMFAFAIFTPASIYYVNAVVDPEDRVKGQTMLGVANMSLVGAIGGITGGQILDNFGVSPMLLLGTIVTGIGFLIIFFTTENTPLAK